MSEGDTTAGKDVRAQGEEWAHGEWTDRNLVWPSARGTPLTPSNLRQLHQPRGGDAAGVLNSSFHAVCAHAITLSASALTSRSPRSVT